MKKQNGDPGWKETNATEIKAYFGLMILIGIHNLLRKEMYWSSDDKLVFLASTKCVYIVFVADNNWTIFFFV